MCCDLMWNIPTSHKKYVIEPLLLNLSIDGHISLLCVVFLNCICRHYQVSLLKHFMSVFILLFWKRKTRTIPAVVKWLQSIVMAFGWQELFVQEAIGYQYAVWRRIIFNRMVFTVKISLKSWLSCKRTSDTPLVEGNVLKIRLHAHYYYTKISMLKCNNLIQLENVLRNVLNLNFMGKTKTNKQTKEVELKTFSGVSSP